MKTKYSSNAAGLIGAWLFLSLAYCAHAQPGTAQVQGVQGNASYQARNGATTQLRKGATVPVGAVVTTERGAAVDLYLGPEVGTIRLTQNSVLILEKLDRAQTFITLTSGSFAGKDAKLPLTSEYQIKLPHGIVGVAEGKYRVDARSYLVLLQGAMVYAYVPADGEPRPYVLKAPPPTYFSPIEGVKPAPVLLQREVELQLKGKLR